MIFGYARVSTKEQSLDRQIDSLKIAGCEEIYKEKISGRNKEKPELEKLFSKLRKGDLLIVDSLDRLGRTSKELINLLHFFKENGINFRSLKEGLFDTTTPMGEAVFQIMAVLKAMEVEVLRERTIDGLKAARARGKNGGRKKGDYDKKKAATAASLYQTKNHSISEILDLTGIGSRSTLYRFLRLEGVYPEN
jgi:DNA invertase Pin-like site-specific DNA recombinase